MSRSLWVNFLASTRGLFGKWCQDLSLLATYRAPQLHIHLKRVPLKSRAGLHVNRSGDYRLQIATSNSPGLIRHPVFIDVFLSLLIIRVRGSNVLFQLGLTRVFAYLLTWCNVAAFVKGLMKFSKASQFSSKPNNSKAAFP